MVGIFLPFPRLPRTDAALFTDSLALPPIELIT